MNISRILSVEPGITALIGAGGKTTLMYRLARELSREGAVIVCTSTKIIKPDDLPVLTDGSKDSIITALKSSRVLCVGTPAENGKLSAPSIPFAELAALADYLIVEADGAHRLPIKAHASYEPAIPESVSKTILVIGADAFGKPICEICHRPELFASIAGVDLQAAVTPEIIRRVITAESLGDCLYLNKAEDTAAYECARELAGLLELPVIAGSLKKEEYLCLR